MHTYTHVHSCTHAHMHACTRALMYSFTQSHIHTCTHALIYVYTHPRTHVLAHTFTHSRMHTCTHLCLHTSTQPTKQPTKQPTTQYRGNPLLVPTIFVITSQPRVLVVFVNQSHLPRKVKPFQKRRFHWLIAHPGVTIFGEQHLLQKSMVRFVAGALQKLATALCCGREHLVAPVKSQMKVFKICAVFFLCLSAFYFASLLAFKTSAFFLLSFNAFSSC